MEGILTRIIDTRKAKKISQKEISEYLGISQAAYAKVEASQSGLTIDRLYKISEFLNVSVAQLLGIRLDSQDGNNPENLINEIERLKKRILNLEEQLNDKRQIIEFLKGGKFAYDLARLIQHDEAEVAGLIPESENIKYLDGLIEELQNSKSEIDFRKKAPQIIEDYLNRLKESQK